MYSDLKIALTYRTGNSTGPSTKRERFFYDFIIDGKSLLKKFLGSADMIGCFSQAIDSSEVYSQLLCLSTPTLLSGRVLLYICPECGDIAVERSPAKSAALRTPMSGQTLPMRMVIQSRILSGMSDRSPSRQSNMRMS